MNNPLLEVNDEVSAALKAGRPVVALESSLIAYGLPWPINIMTARQSEQAVREAGAVPATIAVWDGRLCIGLDDARLLGLAKRRDVRKASRRDLGAAVAQQRTASTTVAATMYLAHCAGIRVFATGGIGGVHRGSARTDDVSADLHELSRTPVAVVCSGGKSILDLPRTLEMLESLGVPVVGYQADEFPAFYVRSSRLRVPWRVDSPAAAASMLDAHWKLDGAGVVIGHPVPTDAELDREELERSLKKAEEQAAEAGVRGSALTPFLLAGLAELTEGRSLRANQALIVANARVAAEISVQYAGLQTAS